MIAKHCEVYKKTDGLLRCGGCQTYLLLRRPRPPGGRPPGSQDDMQDHQGHQDQGPGGGGQSCAPGPLATPNCRPTLWSTAGCGGIDRPARTCRPCFCTAWALQHTDKPEVKPLEDPNLACLHVKNADATETSSSGPAAAGTYSSHLSRACRLQLIKARLLIGLEHLREFRAGLPLGAPVPSVGEILADVRGKYMYCDDIFERRPEVFADEHSIVKKQKEINQRSRTSSSPSGHTASTSGP